MKKILALLICLPAFFLPAAILAQSDGSVATATSTPADAPQGGAVEPAPAPVRSATADTSAAPAPRTQAVAVQTAPAPTSAPTPEPQPAPAPAPAPVSLEDVQGFVEAAAEHAPPAFGPWLSALAGAMAALIAVLGIQQALKRAKKKDVRPCVRCKGTGKESASGACATCGGKGTVAEEQDLDVKCPHCEGEGEEPCEKCEGEGEIRGAACEACGGSGTKRDGDGEAAKCGVCLGEGEASVTLKRDVPCPDCQGGK